jgi:predicted lysophospholipase L1 biosynthesis ABC-type transport system permease subunit
MNRQPEPPMRVAFGETIMGIRVRWHRQLATAIGTMLGVAFFASVQASRAFTPPSNEPTAIETANRLQWLAALSLLMCITGVMNSMLMSVTERYKEIGTLKCLGATDFFIVKVFVLEALIIGFVASLVGAVAGVGLMAALRYLGHSPLHDIWGIAGMVVAKSVVVGTSLSCIAAIPPALQAARLPAVVAMRSDF